MLAGCIKHQSIDHDDSPLEERSQKGPRQSMNIPHAIIILWTVQYSSCERLPHDDDDEEEYVWLFFTPFANSLFLSHTGVYTNPSAPHFFKGEGGVGRGVGGGLFVLF